MKPMLLRGWCLAMLAAAVAAFGSALPASAEAEGATSQPDEQPDLSAAENAYLGVELLADRDAVRAGDDLRLAVRFSFKQPGLHVYGHDMPADGLGTATRIVPAGAGIEFGKAEFPASTRREEHGLAWTEFGGDFTALLPARVTADGAAFTVNVTYQVCGEGQCYDTFSHELTLRLPTRPADVPAKRINGGLFAEAARRIAEATAASDGPARGQAASAVRIVPQVFGIELGEHNWLIALLLSMAVGLVLNFTPCVLPVIPLTVGFFVYQSHQSSGSGLSSRSRVLLTGAVFAAGLVFTFALLGGLVVLIGQQFSFVFNYPGVMLGLGLFMVAMSLGMFGMFSIQLPTFLGRMSGGINGVGGAFVMGMLAAVLSTPCTGPLLGGIIGWATMAPAVLGMSIFIGIGLGMAVPYLLLAGAPGLISRFPRTGTWTKIVKAALGFLLLALAIWTFSGLSEARFQYAVWASVALAAAIWLNENLIKPKAAGLHLPPRIWFSRLAVLAAVGVGISLFWPAESASSGGRHISGSIVWRDYHPAILDEARSRNVPVVLDLVSDNCTYCRIMEKEVLSTAPAAKALDGFLTVRVNTSTDIGRPLLGRYSNGGGAPLMVVLDGNGKLVTKFGFIGEPDEFVQTLAPARRQLGME